MESMEDKLVISMTTQCRHVGICFFASPISDKDALSSSEENWVFAQASCEEHPLRCRNLGRKTSKDVKGHMVQQNPNIWCLYMMLLAEIRVKEKITPYPKP